MSELLQFKITDAREGQSMNTFLVYNKHPDGKFIGIDVFSHDGKDCQVYMRGALKGDFLAIRDWCTSIIDKWDDD